MDWQPFVQAGRPVALLPGRRRPRLAILVCGMRARWHASALYPASRLRARLYRLALRIKAAVRPTIVRPEAGDDALAQLQSLLQEALPDARLAALLLGTPGPAEKLTAEVWNDGREVVGYLKYGEREAARRRLRQEWDLLRSLPEGLGPEPLALFPWRSGLALLTTPLEGRSVPARLPPPGPVVDFCRRLEGGAPVDLARHPWVLELGSQPAVRELLSRLDERRWPVVVQHGDLASWNLRVDGGKVSAFDWEYGTRSGFPGLDLAYYVLQVGALIYHLKPVQARHRAKAILMEQGGGLNSGQADALVQLAAFDAYRKAEQDGHPGRVPIQVWREAIWKN